MNLFRDKNERHPWRLMVATGYVVSLFSYIGFWIFDALRPGFVSRTFSVHLFLLSAVVFGVAWHASGARTEGTPTRDYLLATGGAAVLSAVVWNTGTGFGAFRILMTALAALLPYTVTALLRSTESVSL
jgi:hypothetical protein